MIYPVLAFPPGCLENATNPRDTTAEDTASFCHGESPPPRNLEAMACPQHEAHPEAGSSPNAVPASEPSTPDRAATVDAEPSDRGPAERPVEWHRTIIHPPCLIPPKSFFSVHSSESFAQSAHSKAAVCEEVYMADTFAARVDIPAPNRRRHRTGRSAIPTANADDSPPPPSTPSEGCVAEGSAHGDTISQGGASGAPRPSVRENAPLHPVPPVPQGSP